MIHSHTSALENVPLIPAFFNSVTIRPAGPTANTVPTITSRTTLNTRITFFITPPR